MDERRRGFLAEGERAGLRYALGLPRRTPVGAAGGAPGHRAGSSLEFKDYRDYQAGDDLRHIDWGAYARSDQLSVKLYREEVNPHVDVVVDASRSMALEGSGKERATLALAAFFAAAAANAGFSHTAWLLGAELAPVGNGSAAPSGWDGIDFGHRGGPGDVLGRAPPAWRPRGIRVLLSDLLWVGEPLAVLRHLAERAAVAVVVQVLARADAEPPEGGSLRLVDSETDQVREIHVDAVAARRYRAALARHQQNWDQACRQTGAVLTTVVAEDLVRDWKLDALVAAEVLKVV
jgi:uncharacterized protein (DUF58 family)